MRGKCNESLCLACHFHSQQSERIGLNRMALKGLVQSDQWPQSKGSRGWVCWGCQAGARYTIVYRRWAWPLPDTDQDGHVSDVIDSGIAGTYQVHISVLRSAQGGDKNTSNVSQCGCVFVCACAPQTEESETCVKILNVRGYKMYCAKCIVSMVSKLRSWNV